MSYALTSASLPAGAGQIPLSASTSSDAISWVTPATGFATTPNPDTLGGSAGTSNTFAFGDHSHPQSVIYDGFGIDQVNTVAASGGSVTIPAPSVYQTSWIKLTANCAMVLPAPVLGARFEVYLTQVNAGSFVPTFPANIAWIASTPPVWSTTAGLTDHIRFKCVDGLNWMGEPGALGMVIPPLPLGSVQVVNVYAANASVTFANNITAGNGILAILGPDVSSPLSMSGGGVSWTQIGLLAAPSAPTVVAHGATGSTNYQYEITYVNALGETIASSTTSITNGNATLSVSNYNIVSWTAAPSDAASVNVYGRVSGALGLLATVTVGTTTWNDTGSASPGVAAPGTNTTGSLPSLTYNRPQSTNFVQAWLGTGSSGGPGTATINLGQACQTGTFWEIQNAALATGTVTATGTASSTAPFTTPTMTASAAGQMPWVVALVHDSATVAGIWTNGQIHNSAVNPPGYPTGGPAPSLQYAYQPSTTNGGTYSSTWTPLFTNSFLWWSMSFMLKHS